MSIHRIPSLLITSLNPFGCNNSSESGEFQNPDNGNIRDVGNTADVGPEIPQGEGEEEVVPVEREICDGLDDDNDGETDEGVKNPCGYCGAVPRGVICDWKIVGDGRRYSMYPALAWNDLKGEFGLVWVEAGEVTPAEIRFLKIDANGNTIGKEKVLARNVHEQYMPPTFVWGGNVYTMSWQGEGSAYFGFFDQNGNPLTDPKPISGQALIAWTGTEFGVVYGWEPYRAPNYRFQKFNTSGNELGNERSLNEDLFRDLPDSSYPTITSIAWASSQHEYGLAWAYQDIWEEKNKIYFSRLNEEGQKVSDNLEVSETPIVPIGPYPRIPILVWNNGKYGMIWDDRDDIHFLEVNTQEPQTVGETIDFGLGVDDIESDPSISSWANNFYGVFWTLAAGRVFYKLIMSGPAGPEPVYAHRAISKEESASGGNIPAIAWNGRNFGVAWNDYRLERGNIYQSSIYFTLLEP